ncbi:hypothetical protein HDU98_007820 [Podochytrium sp. JEL0797]|nr:hypothetical protein HDU98_007820 [Podochytrium sp. JEL0797]
MDGADPFDVGEISLGLSFHASQGRDALSCLGLVVSQRNSLRLQNAQLWKIVEKQRLVMDGLKKEIEDLKDENKNKDFDMPSIAQLRKSITEHMFAPEVQDQKDIDSPELLDVLPVQADPAPTHPQPAIPSAQNYTLSSDDGIRVKVAASTFLGTGGPDAILFYILVRKEKTGEEWKIEKRYSDFTNLDNKLRSKVSKTSLQSIGKPPEKSLFTSVSPFKSDQRKVALEMYLQRILEAVPDSREVFYFLTTGISSGTAVAVSQSMGSLPVGLNSMESTNDIDGISSPYSTDAMILKEGYLMKKGKNFGGWKPRYFRCKPFFLDYSDGPFRDSTSSISLKHCHITSIKSAPTDKTTAHGLILTEFHRHEFPVDIDSSNSFPDYKIHHRHILAAESDFDRDDWVALIGVQIHEARGVLVTAERHLGAAVAPSPLHSPHHHPEFTKAPSVPYSIGSTDHSASVTGDTKSGRASPILSPRMSRSRIENGDIAGGSLLRSATTTLERQSSRAAGMVPVTSTSLGPAAVRPFSSVPVSVPANSLVVKNSVDDSWRAMQQSPRPLPMAMGGAAGAGEKERESGGSEKDLSAATGDAMMTNVSTSPASGLSMASGGIAAVKGFMNMAFGKKKDVPAPPRTIDPNRVIFGATLEQAIALSRISDELELPAVVYRCIEYLDFHKASQEEGIYRLSGSSSAIQQLKYLFNLDGDVDLIHQNALIDRMDVHVVAGLLKLYLRELPSPVLTTALQRDFMAITNDRNDRILQLSHLLSLLPRPNYTLLQTLISHLLTIVQSSSTNKMSVRNIGIVFAPTLSVPALVFILLLAEFGEVFCWEDEGRAAVMRARVEEMRGRKERERRGDGGRGEVVSDVMEEEEVVSAVKEVEVVEVVGEVVGVEKVEERVSEVE